MFERKTSWILIQFVSDEDKSRPTYFYIFHLQLEAIKDLKKLRFLEKFMLINLNLAMEVLQHFKLRYS